MSRVTGHTTGYTLGRTLAPEDGDMDTIRALKPGPKARRGAPGDQNNNDQTHAAGRAFRPRGAVPRVRPS
jgi:hypothetical protein